MTGRVLVLVYGVAGYVLFLVTFLYAVGFIGDFLTPTRLDGPREGDLAGAVATNLALLALFAVQHSGMARPAFKRWLTRFIPPAAERATYVVLSSAALLLLFALWRPLGGVVWEVTGVARAAVYVVFATGWVVVLVTTFLIDHFDLFGLRQVILYARGRPYPAARFVTPGPYRVVRHPLYVGWLMVFWAAPTMTAAHLLFAAVTTAYILVAIRWEERDLCTALPEYEAYRRRVPMLIPRFGRRREKADAAPGRLPQPQEVSPCD
ncbi:isoprenylcysteine carboxylmethyltransferase family protein [bacterium]|nr:isoprenylcysteine carboxylmethyltransferase family protein [bacterium]